MVVRKGRVRESTRGARPYAGSDRPREACGVFGVYGHPEAARLAYYALYALQHRGQESAGISVSDGERLRIHKGMGLVSEAFHDRTVAGLEGEAAIGHVRYSTFGASDLTNAQPLVVRFRKGSLALAHNGNLVNALEIRERLEGEGSIFQTGVDTEVVAHLIARLGRNGIEDAIAESLRRVKGGYAILFLTEDKLVAARDPHGIRPLAMGNLGDARVFASESCAFDNTGARMVREVEPGEMVVVDRNGLQAYRFSAPGRESLCIFEFIYFARPDSVLQGRNVHLVRKRLGRQLNREAPVPADVVIGVPDSSLSAASGYAEGAGIPYEIGLVKNRYIGRTFIQPTQETRSFGVRMKLNVLRQVVEGKRVVLVDDSIVRGTTSRHIVRLLREGGAREVHLRISAPPYRFPCYYGIDTSATGELIAAQRAVDDIRERVGADSLHYLSLPGLVEAVGAGEDRFCVACFSGNYVVDVKGGSRYYWDAGSDRGGLRTPVADE